MDLARSIAAALTPALCPTCGRSSRPPALLCASCERRLAAARPVFTTAPPGVDVTWGSAPHEGVARQMVVALKYRRLVCLATSMAERIADRAPAGLLDGAIVAVPPAPARLRSRGFDPAGEIAHRLARDRGQKPVRCLRRGSQARQVGHDRSERLSQRPQISLRGPVPSQVVLVDDVVTTGATLAACAAALRAGGVEELIAVTFTCRL